MELPLRIPAILAVATAVLCPACVPPPPPRVEIAVVSTELSVPEPSSPPVEEVESKPAPALQIRVFTESSAALSRPTARALVPRGYVVIGGGCRSDWKGPGQLLTATIPEASGWLCAAKDHVVRDQASLTAFALAIPKSTGLHVRTVSARGALAAHPTARVAAPDGYTLIGGGCRTNSSETEPGNLLTSSYPVRGEWVCDSKDHERSSPTTVTAFAIAVRADEADVQVYTRNGGKAQHPTARIPAGDGYELVGGGCIDHYSEPGNMLWASYPDADTKAWVCAGKDHDIPSMAYVSAFAIGMKLEGERWAKP